MGVVCPSVTGPEGEGSRRNSDAEETRVWARITGLCGDTRGVQSRFRWELVPAMLEVGHQMGTKERERTAIRA